MWWVNTLRPRQNGCQFADSIFKGICLNENVWISIKIPLIFIPKGPINYIPALVWIMAWCYTGDKPLSEVMMAKFADAYMRFGLNELTHWPLGDMGDIAIILCIIFTDPLVINKYFVGHASIWGKIMIQIYRIWLHGSLYRIQGTQCLLSKKGQQTHSLTLWTFPQCPTLAQVNARGLHSR